MTWFYRGKEVSDEALKGNAGFIYLITDLTTGKRYIGRKYLTFSRKLKKGDKRRTSFESDWRDYYSSSKELQSLVEIHGKENFKREIIAFGKTKGEVNFLEVCCQFHVGVLESDEWLNDAINKWKKAHVRNYKNISEMKKFFVKND